MDGHQGDTGYCEWVGRFDLTKDTSMYGNVMLKDTSISKQGQTPGLCSYLWQGSERQGD